MYNVQNEHHVSTAYLLNALLISLTLDLYTYTYGLADPEAGQATW